MALNMENMGKPIRLDELRVDGVSASAARLGEKVSLMTRAAMTSEQRMFHRIARNLCRVIEFSAQQVGASITLDRATHVCVVIHENATADLWVDTAAVQVSAMLKTNAVAGQPIFEKDIVDLTAMDFPLIEIANEDKVICLFREGWRFGLFFDFNPKKYFQRAPMQRSLGMLLRTMRYSELYDALSNEGLSDTLLRQGWFPFAEIITTEFIELVQACEAGFDLDEEESKVVASFDRERVERILQRWMVKPHFAGKEKILDTAVQAFLTNQPIVTLKLLLTEIEGILADAYKAKFGKGARLKKLLAFAVQSAREKTGEEDSLLFPTAFAKYLNDYTFANYKAGETPPQAGSRHAVGHGAASESSYTLVRALQAILTLDQLAFYT